MSDSKLIPVTDATFAEQVLAAANPVLVKFEAEWCGPCKAMKPMVDDIANEYSGRLTVATVDIEDNQQTVYRLGVRAVPTVVLFKNGEVFAQKVGLPRKADLVALIDKALEKAAASERGKSAHWFAAAIAAPWSCIVRGARRWGAGRRARRSHHPQWRDLRRHWERSGARRRRGQSRSRGRQRQAAGLHR
jgi:thioredoxin 1